MESQNKDLCEELLHKQLSDLHSMYFEVFEKLQDAHWFHLLDQ